MFTLAIRAAVGRVGNIDGLISINHTRCLKSRG